MRIAAFFAIAALFVLGITTTRISMPATAAECDPNYEGACVPIAGDVNCDRIKAMVVVVGIDVYKLDADKDGTGCEKYAKSAGTKATAGAPSSNGDNPSCSTIFVAGKGVIDSCSQGHSSAARVYPRKPGVPANGCAEDCPAVEAAGTPGPSGTPTRAGATPVPSEFTPPMDTGQAPSTPQAGGPTNCDRVSYPDICVPPAPPYLSCSDIPDRNFRVRAPDPHRFDADGNGIGCEQVAGPSIGR